VDVARSDLVEKQPDGLDCRPRLGDDTIAPVNSGNVTKAAVASREERGAADRGLDRGEKVVCLRQ
jgi:hypothetical protein